jgi:xylulokinase
MRGLDFNRHIQAHMFRAAQEGIVFSLKYGFDILKQMGLSTSVVRAGLSNMFLSSLFREAFVNTLNVPLELFETNGAAGAAVGAGVGAGIYKSFNEAFMGLNKLADEEPRQNVRDQYGQVYEKWLSGLDGTITT